MQVHQLPMDYPEKVTAAWLALARALLPADAIKVDDAMLLAMLHGPAFQALAEQLRKACTSTMAGPEMDSAILQQAAAGEVPSASGEESVPEADALAMSGTLQAPGAKTGETGLGARGEEVVAAADTVAGTAADASLESLSVAQAEGVVPPIAAQPVRWVPPTLIPGTAAGAVCASALPCVSADSVPMVTAPSAADDSATQPGPARVPRRIRLPNGTAESAYRAELDLGRADAALIGYRIAAIEGLDAAGLVLDVQQRCILGILKAPCGAPSEIEFPSTLVNDGSRVSEAAVIVLFVNPHPRSLWKSLEPDEALPHRKPHQAHQALHAHELTAVVASVRGRSHANVGSFREDDFALAEVAGTPWVVLAVSDGAGSARLSRLGSMVATAAAVSALQEQLPKVESELTAAVETAAFDGAMTLSESVGKVLVDPVGRAAFLASKAVQSAAVEQQTAEKDLAATLLVAAVRRCNGGLLAAIYWIGDGAVAACHPQDGSALLLGEADSGEFSGQTRFLLSTEFGTDPWASISRRFRCLWAPPGSRLVLMSDGVSDPKFGTDSRLKDADVWTQWLLEDLDREVDPSAAPDVVAADMEQYLGFWSQGEHDDRTLAVVY